MIKNNYDNSQLLLTRRMANLPLTHHTQLAWYRLIMHKCGLTPSHKNMHVLSLIWLFSPLILHLWSLWYCCHYKHLETSDLASFL